MEKEHEPDSKTTLSPVSQPSPSDAATASSMQVTVHRLNGRNFLEWSQSVKLAIDGRGKLGFLTGEAGEPKEGDATYRAWRSENSLVTAWLLNSMEPSIAKPHLFMKTAKEVWDSVRETYSDRENFSQIFELKTLLWHSKQGTRDVTSYYNEMVALWQELDHCSEVVWDNPMDCARQKKREEDDRVFMFLAGVNQNLDEVKGRVLSRRPLPSIREVFSEVRIEESRRKIMYNSASSVDHGNDTAALLVRGNDNGGDKKKKPWCDFCKKLWHTRETCWKIHGKPPGWKPKSERALHTAVEDTPATQIKSGQPSFTQEQIEKLLKLLHCSTNSGSENPSCSFVQNGNHKSVSSFNCVTTNNTWIIDSGASDHMTSNSSIFYSYKPCAGNKKVRIADGSYSAIAGVGDVKISPILTLSNVLHVPKLSCSLISISKLTNNLNCLAKFSSSLCEFQDPISGRMIGSARESDGLYYLDEGSYSNKEARMDSCLQTASISSNDEIYLWHFRLGHPSFFYLRKLFPTLFQNKNPSLFQCEICALAKHHRITYPPRQYQSSKPFALIHTDLWGPSRITSCHGKRWFITLIDDHTRVCWVYLLKEKGEVEHAFKKFYNMILTQFETKIQLLRSDNGREYFAQVLGDFFIEKGIVQQSSCNDTPQQNGIAERKNRHLLEVTRALMFSTNIPKYLWGDALLHATYLINRMPSRVLKFKTPIQILQIEFPKSRLIHNMSPKIFGCIVFIRNPDRSASKLEPKGKKCVYVGIAPNQKGYKCYDPATRKLFTTMDAQFFEKKPFFENQFQGEIQNIETAISIHDPQNLESLANQEKSLRVSNLDFLGYGKETNETSQETSTKNQEIILGSEINHDQHVGLEIPQNNVKSIGNPENLGDFNEIESNHNERSVQNRNLTKNSENIFQNLHPQNLQNVHHSENRSRFQSTRLFGQTYERKKTQQGIENETPLNSQESEPRLEEQIGTYSNLDLPIALRKEKRSCVKYPMSNFVSHSKLSDSFSAFTTNVTKIQIPNNIQEALNVPEWKKAVLEEMSALEKNQTWKVEVLPKGKPTVGCRWIFTPKFNADGILERYKARLVAKGFTQTYGIDYTETFAPVAKLNTVRILLSVAANLDWPLNQLDVKNAFLNGKLEEEVYMLPPPGFEGKFGPKVCKLEKALYGLKQSPRAWFERFTQVVKQQGYVQAHADHTLFTRFSKEGKMAVLIVYVDDILITGDDQEEVVRLKKKLAQEFEIKDLGEMRYFLAMEVARSKLGIIVSQQKYIQDLLKDTGMSGCRPAETPIDANVKLGDISHGTLVNVQQYQRLVGRLIYLSHTRPDIAFAVSMVSQFMHKPCEEHLEAAYRILRYLKSCPGRGLLFKKGENRSVDVFTDADWAGSVTDRKSTSGYCTYVWGNLVTWRSKKQNVVARSSAEAEYRAMANGVCEILWIRRILNELRLELKPPMKLFCDNKAAISIAHNPVQHDRTKHIEVDRHFIKENLEAGVICIPFVSSKDQTADILTKGLFKPTFDFLVNKLGMHDIYAPT